LERPPERRSLDWPLDVKERRSLADRFKRPASRGFFKAVFPKRGLSSKSVADED